MDKIEIRYEIRVEPEDSVSIRDSIDPGIYASRGEYETEMRALEQRAGQDVWAWAVVTVIAWVEVNGERFEGSDQLGGCSYDSEEDFRQGGYFDDMKHYARGDLLERLSAVAKVGSLASIVLGRVLLGCAGKL